MLDKNYLDERGKIKINEYYQSEINPKLFVAGDAIKLGLFTHALGDGRKVALNIDRMFKGLPLSNFAKAPMIPQDRIKKEYYEQINLGKTGKIAPEDETKRCLSCGFCRDCELCLNSCPEKAISRIQKDDGKFEYISNPNKCIGCGICAGICPCGIWEMIDNTMRYLES